MAMYWAEEMAKQTKDAGLAAKFAPIAKAFAENESKIVEEYNSSQGKPIDIGGYYRPDEVKTSRAMRPSQTFNDILAQLV